MFPYVLDVGYLRYIGSHTSLELLYIGFNAVIVTGLENSYLTESDCSRGLRDDQKAKTAWSPLLTFHEADCRDGHAMFAVLRQHGAAIEGIIHVSAHKAISERLHCPCVTTVIT